MNRRFRRLAALLALVGFTALFAESLVAQSCVPADGATGAQAEVAHEGHEGMHHSAPESEPAPDTSVPPHCPLAMVGGSCIVPVTLPASSSPVRLPDGAWHVVVPSVIDAADELVVRPLFHPPKI